MQILTSILAITPIFGLLTLASPLQARQAALQPFEVTASWSESPPGRPGSGPWSLIRASAIDPNSYVVSSPGSLNYTVPGGSQGLNCEARWYRGESPQGRTWPCDSTTDGHWALQVLPGSSGSDFTAISDYKLRFIHAVEPGSTFVNERYEAEASLRTGVNLIGRCLSSGGCSYVLGADFKPLFAPAVKTL